MGGGGCAAPGRDACAPPAPGPLEARALLSPHPGPDSHRVSVRPQAPGTGHAVLILPAEALDLAQTPQGWEGVWGVAREPLTLPSQKSWPAQTLNTQPWPLGQWGSQEVHGEGHSELWR